MPNAPVPFIVLAIAAAACITDLRSRRIPNVLTFGAAAVAIGYHAVTGGAGAAGAACGGWLAGTLVFLPFFLLRGMGAGDVKLLAALGAWLGPTEALWLAAYTAVAGGILAIGMSYYRGYLRTAFNNLRELASFWWFFGVQPLPALTLERSAAPRLAYAIPTFLGTVVTLWL